MEAATDLELVTRFQQTGEVRDMDEFVRRHIGKVRSLVFPMVLNDPDADDVTQETFLNAVRNIHSFRGNSQVSTWLHRIAINTAYNHLRRKKRRACEPEGEINLEQADPSAGPDRRVMGLELGAEIEKALGALPDTLRAAITLTAINGISVKDAARAQGCLVATMYWRVFEARRILGQERWRRLWVADVIVRGEDRIEVAPNRRDDNRLDLWVRALDDGKLAVDTAVSFASPVKADGRMEAVVDQGVPVEVLTLRSNGAEYRVFQTTTLFGEG